MNITATLIGQMMTFAVLVWFIMKYLWDPMTRMLEERKIRIADGLAAAERGKHEHELAQSRALDVIKDGKQQAAEIIAQAQKRAAEIVEESKDQARAEGQRIVHSANAEIEQEINRAREHLRQDVAKLAVAGASQVLQREIDESSHDALLTELAAKI